MAGPESEIKCSPNIQSRSTSPLAKIVIIIGKEMLIDRNMKL